MWQQIVHWITSSVHENYKLRTCCFQKLFWMSKQKTICVHNMFWEHSELAIFKYWTGNSMNNLLSYCGLVDAKIRASDIDSPLSGFVWYEDWSFFKKMFFKWSSKNRVNLYSEAYIWKKYSFYSPKQILWFKIGFPFLLPLKDFRL